MQKNKLSQAWITPPNITEQEREKVLAEIQATLQKVWNEFSIEKQIFVINELKQREAKGA